MEKFTVTITGYEQIEKGAISVGNSAGVLVPRRWLGKRVHCVLLEPSRDDNPNNEEI
ncbi:DUF2080 family transposase-associated protein [Candidatus Nomurabacteria bacterium]|nr:DUF2080 family transposase-associated protein [Candidatus Nomurabacteria bacterium]